jgi:hypothetical protein
MGLGEELVKLSREGSAKDEEKPKATEPKKELSVQKINLEMLTDAFEKQDKAKFSEALELLLGL